MRIILLLLWSLASCLGQNIIDSYRYAAATTPLPTNLVSYFQMDEASGSITDIHGGKTFTLTGGINSVAGVINTARTPATINDYATRADDTSFEPGSSAFFTCMWVKPSNLTQPYHPTLFGKWVAAGNQAEWIVAMVSGGGLVLDVTANGSTIVEVYIAVVFTDTTTWKFIAAGWDGTNLKVSIDGGAFVTQAFAGPVFAGTSVVGFFIRNIGSSPVAFQGAIDEVSFWKGRSLTLAEVQTIYNSGTGKPYSTW